MIVHVLVYSNDPEININFLRMQVATVKSKCLFMFRNFYFIKAIVRGNLQSHSVIPFIVSQSCHGVFKRSLTGFILAIKSRLRVRA